MEGEVKSCFLLLVLVSINSTEDFLSQPLGGIKTVGKPIDFRKSLDFLNSTVYSSYTELTISSC